MSPKHLMQIAQEVNLFLGSGSVNIFGHPFAGKDTLAHNLSVLLNAPVVSGGDILRSHEDQETIKQLMRTGELFPTDYYLGIVLPFLAQEKLQGKPLILSSLGRWTGEEKTIMNACVQTEHAIKAVIHLKVSEETVWERLEASQAKQDRAHRHDDAEHILAVRLKEFQEKTLPVLEFYREKGLLIEVDGHKEITDTTNDALQHLHTFLRKH